MRLIRILYLGFAAAALAGFTERITHLADSATSCMHLRLKCLDECFQNFKNTAVKKFHNTLGMTREIVRKNEIFKPRSLDEFKEMISKLVEKGKAKVRKSKTADSKKREEEKKKEEVKKENEVL